LPVREGHPATKVPATTRISERLNKIELSELSPQWQKMVAVGTGKGSSMKWRTAVVGALASALITTAASAEVRVTNDPGGEISAYVSRFHELRRSGERLVIDGPCLSACTLFTAFLPHSQVCVTPRAVLGFHAASYYDDASRSLVPTRTGTRLVMRLYPPAIRDWIERHGGLTPRIIGLRGRELAALYNTCR
jgi:hypothetical protein